MDHPDPLRQLTLLTTTPRVAPGLLSASAWDALRRADTVLAADADSPTAHAVATAGMDVAAPQSSALADPHALAAYLLSRSGWVVWVGSPDGDPGLAESLAAHLPEEDPPTLELLVGSWDVPGGRLLDAVTVMDRLRSPGGCPWDGEQTHASLTPYLIEEAHEAAEVLEQLDTDTADRDHAVEELGDVLLQVLFHARVAADHGEDPFDVDDVAATLVQKLVRRHPHVFADGQARDPAAVEATWETIKAQENPARAHPLDGIPGGMPSLARAGKVASRLGRSGRAEWLREWVRRQEGAGDAGAALLGAVLELRSRDVDADAALRHTLRALARDVPGRGDAAGR